MKNTATQTKNYYYYSGNKIYFGNEGQETGRLFKDMERASIRAIEMEVNRLNKQGGYTLPVDDWED